MGVLAWAMFSAAREEEVLANVLAANDGPLDAVTVKSIFRELISGSRAIQKQFTSLTRSFGPPAATAVTSYSISTGPSMTGLNHTGFGARSPLRASPVTGLGAFGRAMQEY